MSKFTLNNERILNKYNYAPYDINFWLYDVENISVSSTFDRDLNKSESKAIKNTNKSCFAELPVLLEKYIKLNSKEPNRIMFHVNPKKHPTIQLTKEEIREWTIVCKKHKIIPKNIGPLFLRTMFFIIKPSKLNIQQIYLYLMAARYIQEEPFVIRTILYLLEEEVDFWIALTVALQVCGTSTGHSFLPLCKNYRLNSYSFDPNRYKYNLTYAQKFRVFIEENEIEKASKPLNERVKEVIGSCNRSCTLFVFLFHDFLNKVKPFSEKLKAVSAADLKNPEIVKLVHTS